MPSDLQRLVQALRAIQVSRGQLRGERAGKQDANRG